MAIKESEDGRCWVVTDGSTEAEKRALGIALGTGFIVTIKSVGYKTQLDWIPGNLSSRLGRLSRRAFQVGSDDQGSMTPWPDLVVTADPTSDRYAIKVKSLSEGRTKIVKFATSSGQSDDFDLVIAPHHELVAGPNIFSIIGFPHCANAIQLNSSADRVSTKLAGLPRPLVAVLIGGENRSYRLTSDRLEEICEQLVALKRKEDAGLVICLADMVSQADKDLVARRFENKGAILWHGRSEDEYFGLLGLADHFVVTADAETSTCEAAVSGKPIHFFSLPGGTASSRRFQKDLEEYGAIRAFSGSLDAWTYEPLAETSRAGKVILDLIAE